jgi:DHA1 family bicyclomycin/chloramphenicol resistance-like MFS transporter
VSAATIAASGSAFVLAGACLSAYFLFDRVLTAPGLFVPVAISAFGIGLAVPGTNAGVMQVRPDLSGTASGLMGFEQYVFAAIFAQLVATGGSRASDALALTSVAGAVGAVAFGWLSFGRSRTLALSR